MRLTDTRKVMGILQSSSVYPLRLVHGINIISIYHGDKLLLELSYALFDQLTPNEILHQAGVKVK